jgi:hypothetical protein
MRLVTKSSFVEFPKVVQQSIFEVELVLKTIQNLSMHRCFLVYDKDIKPEELSIDNGEVYTDTIEAPFEKQAVLVFNYAGLPNATSHAALFSWTIENLWIQHKSTT